MEKEAAEERKRIEREVLEAKRQFARDSLALAAEELTYLRDTGQIGGVEMLQRLRRLKAQEHALERQALEEKKALYRENTLEYQKARTTFCTSTASTSSTCARSWPRRPRSVSARSASGPSR
jgi:hypothetical protein